MDDLNALGQEFEWTHGMSYWPSRWNNTKGPIATTVNVNDFPFTEPATMFTCGMGVMYIKNEDIPAFVAQMRKALKLLEKVVK